MKRALLLVGVLAALAASLAGPAAATDAAPATTERLQALDQEILVKLNATRAAHGLRPVVLSSDLQNAADFHSKTMLAKGFFAHDTPGGAPFVSRVRRFYRSAGYNTWSVGENLLYSTDVVTAQVAIDAWLASPDHRKNMLTPGWREVGIGSMRASTAGGLFAGEPTWVITMDFGMRSGKAGAPKVSTKAQVTVRKTTTTEKATTARTMTSAKPKKPKAGGRPKGSKPAKKSGNKAKSPDRTLPTPSHDVGDDGGAATPPDAKPADDPGAAPGYDAGDDADSSGFGAI